MKKIRNLVLFFAMIIILGGVNVYAASEGNRLEQPESGWRRYDDSNALLIKELKWLTGNLATQYNESLTYTNTSEAQIKFKFKGTKLRIISTVSNIDGTAIPITIDGKKETYNINNGRPLKEDYSCKEQILAYEKLDLIDSVHEVVIGVQEGYYSNIDAIDIDNDGYLVSIDKKLKLVLEVKEEKQLSVTDNLTDNTDMAWTSLDTTIATVDANGKLKALKPGDTVITCTNDDGSYTETINILVVNLDLQLAVDLNAGEKCRLAVSDLMNNLKITWKVDNSNIATVDTKGKVTAISEGLTYISALDETGIELGRIYVRVR